MAKHFRINFTNRSLPMSTKSIKQAASRITAADLSTLAAQAVERATQARKAFVELNQAELQTVSGGAARIEPLQLDITKITIRGGTAGIIYYPPIKNVLF
jgi:hypothetical protein